MIRQPEDFYETLRDLEQTKGYAAADEIWSWARQKSGHGMRQRLAEGRSDAAFDRSETI